MASSDVGELFEALPEQAAPERAVRRCPRLRIAERRQVELRAVTLDELVPADHRVRLVWRFVEELDLTALHATIKAVESKLSRVNRDIRRRTRAFWWPCGCLPRSRALAVPGR